MNFADIVSALQMGVAYAEQLAPLAGLAGPQGAAIGKIVGSVAQLAEAALAHAQDAANLVSANDLATVRALQARIQAANDLLGAQVDQS